MDELARMQAVRLQRQATDISIQQTDAWVKVHRDGHPYAFTDMVNLYVYSLSVDTVGESRPKPMPTFQQLQVE